jgi:hypothetical protein
VNNKAQKFYGLVGKILCTVAGGIIGFVLNPILAVPGLLAGFAIGYFLEKGSLRLVPNNK